jgi:P27 family predicted phage terminase small subunit
MPNARKSEENKNIQGTGRKDRSKPESIEAATVDDIPKPPSILGKIGRKIWKKYCDILHKQGLLAETDLDLLGQYCMYLQIAEQAAEELNKDLTEIMTNAKEPYTVKSKYLSIFNEASDRASKLGKEFGFTPLSRKNIPPPKKEKKGKLMKLMGGDKK